MNNNSITKTLKKLINKEIAMEKPKTSNKNVVYTYEKKQANITLGTLSF